MKSDQEFISIMEGKLHFVCVLVIDICKYYEQLRINPVLTASYKKIQVNCTKCALLKYRKYYCTRNHGQLKK